MSPSSTLGRYRILKELGRGNMGRVLLAHDPTIDRQVAIKTFHVVDRLSEADQQAAKERFLREARAAGKLSHPGIVTIFDVGEHEGVPYLAMEYVEGTPLDTYTSGTERLSTDEAVEIIAHAAEALDYAHREGVIHRDIKPANLIRVGPGRVKIADFGLAKDPASQLTQDGALLGTPSYMAPEQIRGLQTDGRSDLFSLAVVLYELLTGEKPFPGDSVSSVLYRIVHEAPRDPRKLKPDLPDPLVRFLRKALAKDPSQRFRDGRSFAQALREAWTEARTAPSRPAAAPGETGARRPPARPVPPPPPPRRRRRRGRAGGWLALVLLLAGGGLGGAWWASPAFRDQVRQRLDAWLPKPQPKVVELQVRAEPPEAEILWNGEPLSAPTLSLVEDDPGGVLEARLGCRTARQEVRPPFVPGEIVLVLDPLETSVTVDPGVEGARVLADGRDLGPAPVTLALDLCEPHVVAIEAPGYRRLELQLPAGLTPLEARTQVADLRLDPIPMGRLRLPKPPVPLKLYLDGEPVQWREEGWELPEGEHRLRVVSTAYWLDVTVPVTVEAGRVATPSLPFRRLATLVVQAYPPNCKVYLRKPGGSWTYVDTTPMRKRLAPGRYEVRVEFVPTGESRTQAVELREGGRTPVRFSFVRGR